VCKGHPEYYQDLAARLALEAEAATGEPVLYIDQVGCAGWGGGCWLVGGRWLRGRLGSTGVHAEAYMQLRGWFTSLLIPGQQAPHSTTTNTIPPTPPHPPQFNNPANPRAHMEGTGPEIWRQLDGRVDAFVAGVGSGGTLAGTGAFLRSVNPGVEIVLADPVGSVLAPLVREGKCGAAGSWMVEGVGEDFVPSVLDLGIVSSAYSISDGEAFAAARELLRKEGVLGGSSAGVLLAAALKYCREQTVPKRVVTVVCDTGARYLSKQVRRVCAFGGGLGWCLSSSAGVLSRGGGGRQQSPLGGQSRASLQHAAPPPPR